MPPPDTSNDRAIAIVLASEPSLDKSLPPPAPKADTSNDRAIAALLATQHSVPKALPAPVPTPLVVPAPPNSTSTPAVPMRGGARLVSPTDTSNDHAIAKLVASEPSASKQPPLAASDSPASPFADLQEEREPELVADLQRDMTISRQLSNAPSMQIAPRPNAINAPQLTGNDHRDRLLLRLALYNLTEKQVTGDGACQFRALSDQLFGTPEHYKSVRAAVIKQLKHDQKKYAAYITTDYKQYVKDMAQPATWGDHITLQAAADTYGVRIEILTSYPDNFVIKITPAKMKHNRVLWLSFWAELHYNSILLKADPAGGEVGSSTLAAQAARPSQRRRRSSWSGADLGPRPPPPPDTHLHAPRTGLLAKSGRVLGQVLTLGLKK